MTRSCLRNMIPRMAPSCRITLGPASSNFRMAPPRGRTTLPFVPTRFLDDKVLLQLCMIYAACEKAGMWPSQWDTVLICLLVKKDGGFRPIGIFMSPIRIYSKARFDLARCWENNHPRPCLYGVLHAALNVPRGLLPSLRSTRLL